jgi:hypothetical protein
MKSVLKDTVLISLFCAMPALSFAQTPQSDAAGVREAIRVQKQKDAADARQAQREASKPNRTEATAKSDSKTESADRVGDPGEGARGATDKSGKSSDLQEAIRFEKAKDAAAARQARIEARRPSVNSADRQDRQ